MGRRIPSVVNPLIHSTFSLSLLAAYIAATIAIVAALCGARSRKTSPPSPPPSRKKAKKSDVVATTMTRPKTPPMPPPPTTTKAVPLENSTEKTTPQIQEQQQPSIPNSKDSLSLNYMTNSMSKRKLMVSLSMKMPGGALSAKYRARKEEEQQQKLKRLKPDQDSIWKKTIILGERCRIPNEEDAIIYDDRGNRIAAYPTRTPRSLPVSRTNSFIDRDTTF